MEKHLTLIRRAPLIERGEFHERFLAAARLAFERRPGLGRCIVNLVDVPAEEAGLRPGGQPAFDAVTELWLDRDDQVEGSKDGLIGESHAYRVDETTEREYERTWPDGERSPGVKSFYLAQRRDDLTHEQFADYWGNRHAPLALQRHVGMWRYTRNVVAEALSPGAQPWDGMAILHFRTAQDLRERFYDSDEGRRAIAADVANFTVGGRALHTSEYILRS